MYPAGGLGPRIICTSRIPAGWVYTCVEPLRIDATLVIPTVVHCTERSLVHAHTGRGGIRYQRCVVHAHTGRGNEGGRQHTRGSQRDVPGRWEFVTMSMLREQDETPK